QARPLVLAVKAQHPELPVVVTHFSPSGYNFAMRRPCADLHDYLPYDHPRDMDELVALWQPRLLVFVKFDCWPNQILATDRAGVPILLMAGGLQPNSTRLKAFAKPLYRDLFNRFAHIGVCTEEDRERFVSGLGTDAPVSVTGDTRAEQVILRYEASRAGETCERLRCLGGRLLILGSTWQPDEELWLPILPQLMSDFPELRVVLTPHEPLPERLKALEEELQRRNVTHVRLSELMSGPTPNHGHPARVVLVDSIGLLAEIYRAGHLAYVGGSFTTGVHNTMEPAIAELPVMFGPKIHNAEEAGLLKRRGVGYILETPEEALACATRLLASADELAKAGKAAKEVVLEQRGATERSMRIIEPYLQ
ncbi:MAG: 3-deoxy-D-manno-octulosonic-acid transferase, partial [Candidatus Krumholzibacteriia bacterium]